PSFSQLSSAPRDLHSFPTRRSSDLAYLEDPIHEAGFFIRKYLRQWPYYQKRDNLPAKGKTSTAREIHITGVPKNASQTKYAGQLDRKSTRLNSSHVKISYAVFCLKK